VIGTAVWHCHRYESFSTFASTLTSARLCISGDYEFYAPPIEDFQEEAVFSSNEPVPIKAGQGWLFVIRNKDV
jgi:hypothetical protein